MLLNTKRQHELPEQSKPLPAEQKWRKEECMQRESEKRIIRENSNDRRKGTDQSDVVQMTLYAAKSQKTYAKVRGEGRAMMRHTGST